MALREDWIGEVMPALRRLIDATDDGLTVAEKILMGCEEELRPEARLIRKRAVILIELAAEFQQKVLEFRKAEQAPRLALWLDGDDLRAVPLDPKRSFSPWQRQQLFLRAKGRCQICSESLASDWQADHIIPYSRGGRTVIENGQATCALCNLRKSDNVALTESVEC